MACSPVSPASARRPPRYATIPAVTCGGASRGSTRRRAAVHRSSRTVSPPRRPARAQSHPSARSSWTSSESAVRGTVVGSIARRTRSRLPPGRAADSRLSRRVQRSQAIATAASRTYAARTSAKLLIDVHRVLRLRGARDGHAQRAIVPARERQPESPRALRRQRRRARAEDETSQPGGRLPERARRHVQATHLDQKRDVLQQTDADEDAHDRRQRPQRAPLAVGLDERRPGTHGREQRHEQKHIRQHRAKDEARGRRSPAPQGEDRDDADRAEDRDREHELTRRGPEPAQRSEGHSHAEEEARRREDWTARRSLPQMTNPPDAERHDDHHGGPPVNARYEARVARR